MVYRIDWFVRVPAPGVVAKNLTVRDPRQRFSHCSREA
jgi:hypothetical protein